MSVPGKAKQYLITKFTHVGLVVISAALTFVGYKAVIKPWYTYHKLTKAEEFANIIYEQQERTRTQQSNKT